MRSVDRVVARRRGFAEQHLRVGDPGGLQPRVAGLVEAAVDARRGGRAVGVELRLQEGGVVGLVPDREQRHLRAEVARHRGHEFLEVLVVGARDVGRFAGSAVAHRGTGEVTVSSTGQCSRLASASSASYCAPVVAGRVGRLRSLGASRWSAPGATSPQYSSTRSALTPSVLQLCDRLGRAWRGSSRSRGGLEVTSPGAWEASAWRGRRSAAPAAQARRAVRASAGVECVILGMVGLRHLSAGKVAVFVAFGESMSATDRPRRHRRDARGRRRRTAARRCSCSSRCGRFLDEHGLGEGEIEAQPIGEGHSNVTYLIERGEREIVLRRPPRPPLPPSAHDVLREARLLRALASTPARVPEVLAVCDDEAADRLPLLRDGARAGRGDRRRACPPRSTRPQQRRRDRRAS